MIQPSLLSAPASKVTLCDRLAKRFRACPNIWLDARGLLEIGGFGGWRTRISDLRKPPYSMAIDNKVRTTVLADGARITHSYYRFVP